MLLYDQSFEVPCYYTNYSQPANSTYEIYRKNTALVPCYQEFPLQPVEVQYGYMGYSSPQSFRSPPNYRNQFLRDIEFISCDSFKEDKTKKKNYFRKNKYYKMCLELTDEGAIELYNCVEKAFKECKRKCIMRVDRKTNGVLREWVINNVRYPYPSTQEKSALLESSGERKITVENWFCNVRKIIWKPILMRIVKEDKKKKITDKKRKRENEVNEFENENKKLKINNIVDDFGDLQFLL